MHASLVEWWNGISLRTKITGVTVLLLTVGLVISGFGTMLVLRDYLVRDIDQRLAQRVTGLTLQDATTDPASRLTDYVFAELTPSGRLAQANELWQHDPPQLGRLSPAEIDAHGDRPFSVRDARGDSSYRVVLKQVGGNTLVLGLSLATADGTIQKLIAIFLLFGVVVIVLSAVITRLLVGSTFGPLRQVERTAAAIADGDFGQRLGNATPNTDRPWTPFGSGRQTIWSNRA